MYNTDLTFFTNEPERTLSDRFNAMLKTNTQYFDVLVGYFRASGFYLMKDALEHVEKIRILIGINADIRTMQVIEASRDEGVLFSTIANTKTMFSRNVETEFSDSEDKPDVESATQLFIRWIRDGKIELKVYPDALIHAKIYIVRKNPELSPDYRGSVITGSSNFSQAGLKNNLEFNVELKDGRDVQFALDKFEELWAQSVDVSQDFIETVNTSTWLNDEITPYELYLKTIYEFFKEEINDDVDDDSFYELPQGFMHLRYQTDAVMQAKKILDAYGGVFISDVVGLGKTYICAMLAKRIKGKKLVICPPVLKEYWESVLRHFEVGGVVVESLGKLDTVIDKHLKEYDFKAIFVDEAHRFRNATNDTYSQLHKICQNKKVVLITATPQNNYSADIANQIFLFQPRNNSEIIPNRRDIEGFFKELEAELKVHPKNSKEYKEQQRKNSKMIRDQVLRHIMIRRTRREVEKFYRDDLERQKLVFPKLSKPEPVAYCFDAAGEIAFDKSLLLIRELTYARYTPLKYLEKNALIREKLQDKIVGEVNLGGFMKTMLLKRLESSVYAFRLSLSRFIASYEQFIKMFNNGKIYISKRVDVYDLLESGSIEELEQAIEQEGGIAFASSDFRPEYRVALQKDFEALKEMLSVWESIKSDPKIAELKLLLKLDTKLSSNKVVIFTESSETADYLDEELSEIYPGKVVKFAGGGSKKLREKIERNFNPNAVEHEDELQYLITTDILAEGINLHRANCLINYDLPWNPTRIMQRVGRINRVGTIFDSIHVYNFFPASQTKGHLSLEETIINKIQAFHDALGEDYKYLSDDEEVGAHQLYRKLTTDELYGEEETDSELHYLQLIRKIRDENPNLFGKIKKLPKKAKTGRKLASGINRTVSFLRKGALKKFFQSGTIETARELVLEDVMAQLVCAPEEPRIKPPSEFYQHLAANKAAFTHNLAAAFGDSTISVRSKNEKTIIKYLSAVKRDSRLTDDDESLIARINKAYEEGRIPPNVSKEILKKIKNANDGLSVFRVLRAEISSEYLVERQNKHKSTDAPVEVLLSMYIQGE
ncbi:MAG: helicase-related protein [Negativicutes bacterium]